MSRPQNPERCEKCWDSYSKCEACLLELKPDATPREWTLCSSYSTDYDGMKWFVSRDTEITPEVEIAERISVIEKSAYIAREKRIIQVNGFLHDANQEIDALKQRVAELTSGDGHGEKQALREMLATAQARVAELGDWKASSEENHAKFCQARNKLTQANALIEGLREELKRMHVRYDERGAAMRETGDQVRSLFQGSEVSKRIVFLQDKIEGAKNALGEGDLRKALEILNTEKPS